MDTFEERGVSPQVCLQDVVGVMFGDLALPRGVSILNGIQNCGLQGSFVSMMQIGYFNKGFSVEMRMVSVRTPVQQLVALRPVGQAKCKE